MCFSFNVVVRIPCFSLLLSLVYFHPFQLQSRHRAIGKCVYICAPPEENKRYVCIFYHFLSHFFAFVAPHSSRMLLFRSRKKNAPHTNTDEMDFPSLPLSSFSVLVFVLPLITTQSENRKIQVYTRRKMFSASRASSPHSTRPPSFVRESS
jgi:hypothetical protein